MTDKEAYRQIRGLGLSVSKRDGEYRVNFKGGTEASAYYTNDKVDTVSTAYLMAQTLKPLRVRR